MKEKADTAMDVDQLEKPQAVPLGKADELISAPSRGCKDDSTLSRCSATYSCSDERFRISQRHYDRQFAQLYFARLTVMSQAMRTRVCELWPELEVAKILDVGKQYEGREVAVVGTVYKDMKLKPSILDEYTKDRGLRAALGGTSFCSDDDTLVLEDEGARMALRGDILPVHDLVTGVVLAVRGVAEPGGDFLVNDMCYAGMAPQPARPLVSQDKYVALVSGLSLGSSQASTLQVQMAVDFLTGNLGSSVDQQLASQITRLVIAGGTVGALDQVATATPYSRQQTVAMQPIKDMDMYLTELAVAMDVDIMPGAEDPSNVALPQQPLHRCLFPGAAAYSSLRRCTNPHEFEVDGVRFLGTSGQNVDDMAKYSRSADRLSLLASCLEWRHIAPTAPDTLTVYPFHDADPFIVDTTPHVMFVGNQPELGIKQVKGPAGQEVLLVALPSFARTGQVVLVNLSTLKCHPMSFGQGA